MITGINHITLAVRDPEESFKFYTNVLGFKALTKWPKGSYLLAGDMWITLVADDNARESPLPEYTHVAFSVSDSDYPELCRRISESEVNITIEQSDLPGTQRGGGFHVPAAEAPRV